MTDLEQTDEFPVISTAHTLEDNPVADMRRRHIALRKAALMANGVMATLAIDMAKAGRDRTDYALRTAAGYRPISALFAAAIGLLRDEPDKLASLCKLADAFPEAKLNEVCTALREAAVLLHADELRRGL